MKKIVVLGSTGMAGNVVFNYFLQRGIYNVYGVARSEKDTGNTKSIDVTDLPKLQKYLEDVNPDVIINCIGILPNECEKNPSLAILLNSYLPQWLAKTYSDTNTKIIHLSSDCVFSGKTGNYTETDFKDADNVYGRTKSLGEIINSKDLTFRMSKIGPELNPEGVGLFNWFMKHTTEINGYSDAWWNGITTLELSKGIEKAIEQDLKGLYHLVPKENINKYDLLILFKKIFNRDTLKVNEFKDFKANKCLMNTRTDFDFHIGNYEEMIKEMKEWINDNKELYPHYKF